MDSYSGSKSAAENNENIDILKCDKVLLKRRRYVVYQHVIWYDNTMLL